MYTASTRALYSELFKKAMEQVPRFVDSLASVAVKYPEIGKTASTTKLPGGRVLKGAYKGPNKPIKDTTFTPAAGKGEKLDALDSSLTLKGNTGKEHTYKYRIEKGKVVQGQGDYQIERRILREGKKK